MFVNTQPRYEILSQEAMAKLDKGWRRLLTEVGIEFRDQRALDLFAAHGQKVEGDVVFLDPEFVLAQAAPPLGLAQRNRLAFHIARLPA